MKILIIHKVVKKCENLLLVSLFTCLPYDATIKLENTS